MARILIIDDDPFHLEMIRDLLDGAGHEFVLTANGAEAFGILKKESFDLAIVDRNMPGMTGIEIVKMMRQMPKFAKLKILMCTGSSVTKEIDEAFNAGADDYILKPINPLALKGKVAKALSTPKP